MTYVPEDAYFLSWGSEPRQRGWTAKATICTDQGEWSTLVEFECRSIDDRSRRRMLASILDHAGKGTDATMIDRAIEAFSGMLRIPAADIVALVAAPKLFA